MTLIFKALSVALAAYLVAALALFLVQDRILLPSTPDAADPRATPRPGETVDAWRIDGNDAGYIVTPEGRAPRGTFVVYHGNEESAETKLPLADVFAHAGYRVAIVEYPGHGRRAGARTIEAAVASSREALSAVLAQWRTPVYLVGESLGAGMASQAVRGNEAAIAGVVLITPWDSLASVAAEKYPIFPVRWMLHDRLDSVAAVSRFGGPLVIVGAGRDTLIPVDHAQGFARAHANANLMLLPSADHDNWFDVMSTQQWQQILQWLHAAD
jgi:uncharacterized protein